MTVPIAQMAFTWMMAYVVFVRILNILIMNHEHAMNI